MTTKRKIGIAVLTVAAAGMLFGMVACSEAENLKQPQALHIENEILYWDEVENAEGYLVEVNGEEYEAEENEFSFIKIAVDPQEYTFRVQAYGPLYGEYGNSAWSEEVSYTPQIATGWSVRQTADGSGTEVYVEDPAQVQGKVVIPATYGGVPVTNIAENAFKDCAGLTSVVMSDNIRYIGKLAFYKCPSLKSVYCSDMAELAENIFSECESLEQVHLPETLKKMPVRTFYMCYSLQEITLPEGLEEMSNSSFLHCTALRELNVPASVTSIRAPVILGCSGLEKLTVEEGNPVYRSEGNCILTIDGEEVIAGCEASEIPQGTKRIGEKAFYSTTLTQLYLPEGIEEIGEEAFLYSALTSVEFPKTLKRVGSRAYYYSEDLKEIDLPYGLEIIEDGAFQKTDLVCVTIPYSVREIQSKAFYEILNLLVTLPGSVGKIGSKAFCRATIYTSADKTVPEGWYQADPQLQSLNIDWDWRYVCNVVYGCIFGNEDGFPYVQRTNVMERVFLDSGIMAGVTNLEFDALSEYGQEIIVPYREGYTFKGWATEENGEIVIGYELFTYKNMYGEVLLEYYSTFPLSTLIALEDGLMYYPIWEKNN